MSWSLFPFSLEGDRSHDLPVVQNLDFFLIGIPSRYIYLILNGTFEGWFSHTLVRCLVNFTTGQAVKLNQDPHKSQFSLSQETFKVWPQPKLVSAWDEVELSLKAKVWERTMFSILLSLFSLPAISARCIKNPRGLSPGILLQNCKGNPIPHPELKIGSKCQQIRCYTHVCPQGGLTPLPPP